MAYLFSSESVSEGHPDKVSDQISDALLDQFLAYDDQARCAIESRVLSELRNSVRCETFYPSLTQSTETAYRRMEGN